MVAFAYKRWSSRAHQFDGLLVVVYEKFQLEGFDRENFGVLDLWTLVRGDRRSTVIQISVKGF